MLSFTENIVLLVAVLAGAICLVRVLNRFWPLAVRSANNQQVGWQLSVLGTTYAVTLGFMLYTCWSSFSGASLNAELEANALRNVYRLAGGLSEPQRGALETQTRAYAQAVIDDDWPQMDQGHIPEASHRINEAMWKTLMSIHSSSANEATAEDHALTELTALTQHRRTRLLQSVSSLPAILWCVLLVGALLTIVSVSMFGAADSRLHQMQVLSITLLIVLVMLAIADIDQPFRGWVHIDRLPFERALESMTAAT